MGTSTMNHEKSRIPESLSIVIPCHNEEAVLPSTYATLKSLLSQWQVRLISDYEIVLVNNGSTDQTLEVMLDLQKEDTNIVIVDLRNNYGYQGSITAGLHHATKNMVVSIDADLQDDPAKIGEMIEKYSEGYDMVLGVRQSRKSDRFLKRMTAQWYYKFLHHMHIKSVFNHGDFRLLSRTLVDEFKKLNERNRYIRGMILNLDNHYTTVTYDRTKRKAGKPKFDAKSLFALSLDGITSFSTGPIRVISILGIFMSFVSIVGMIYVLYVKFIRGVEVPGWAFLAIVIIFFGGLQNLSIGIIGEYIGKIYIESKQRPLYHVRKIYKKEN